MGCLEARAVGRLCYSIVGVLLLPDSSIPCYFGLPCECAAPLLCGGCGCCPLHMLP
eukprot:COSAG01_NODE_4929_length_4614_cov_15.381395_4_plen_56_part_00